MARFLHRSWFWTLNTDLVTIIGRRPCSFRVISTDGINPDKPGVPVAYQLEQNHPNPFNPTTSISYALPQTGPVSLRIFDVVGREIRTLVNGVESAGYKIEEWDGRNSSGRQVASGIYIYRLESGSFVKSRKMMLIR